MLYPIRNLCVIFCYFLFYFLFFLCYKRGESKTHRKAPLLGFCLPSPLTHDPSDDHPPFGDGPSVSRLPGAPGSAVMLSVRFRKDLYSGMEPPLLRHKKPEKEKTT
jgi:hypothetical protein